MIAGTSQRREPHRRPRRPRDRRVRHGLRRLRAHRHLAVRTRTASANPGTKCYEVRDPHDLAIVAACGMGACFGFLWWNASPAKIFMGDTGSLALGGALAGLAITQPAPSCCSSCSAACSSSITLSVIIQVG